jgi:serine/threonine kinase 32
MRYAFQDDENCFFVLDLMLGGDLRFHLDRRGPMPEAAIRLWVAELASAVEYLHRQRIIHRDIKPDNILLDSEGHAHLTDFNVAIHYSEKRLHTSIGGSMAYMAPEMLATRESRSGREPVPRGYTWCIDWWSLGVTAFELAYFRRPFDAKSSEKMKELILTEPIRFEPREGKQVNLSSACESMLQGVSLQPRYFIGRNLIVFLDSSCNGIQGNASAAQQMGKALRTSGITPSSRALMSRSSTQKSTSPSSYLT